MLRTTILALAATLALGLALGSAPLIAQEHEGAAGESPEDTHASAHVTDYGFSFEGPFGSFDQSQLQRGLQVYTEVCAACHGLRYVAYRELAEHGGVSMTEEQMRAYAAMFEVTDADTGETRPATPSDHFPMSAIETAPDLSLMAKARAGFHGPVGLGINQLLRGTGGPEYIASLLTGFTGEEQELAGTVLYGNTAFAGGWISMVPPLSDDLVTYQDGTPATIEQMSLDVSAFLMWAAEPKMMDRKAAGMTAVLFLIVLCGLLYFTNKKVWAPHKSKRDA